MAKELPELLAEVRAGTGKGAARTARRENKVPGVIYGAGKDPVSINMNFHYLLKRLKQGRFLSTLFNIKVEGGEEVHVVCRGVQRDVVKDMPTHIDFMRINDDSRINLFIHVDFINADKAPGIKRGGVLTTVRAEVELEVVAGNIPDHITVDLEGKKIGDVIHINDVVLPEGAKPTVDRNFVIANIAAPSGLLASDDEAAE